MCIVTVKDKLDGAFKRNYIRITLLPIIHYIYTATNSKYIQNLEYMAYSLEKTLPFAWLDEKLHLL